jgi:YesN/AraC family two-component response regulator
VLDISMPTFGGIEAAARIRRVAPKARIVFLSQHRLERIAQAALASGGHAYVVKSAASTDLIRAILAAAQGKQFISQLEDGYHGQGPDDSVDDEKPAVTLLGVVEKIVRPVLPNEPEKAQIAIQGADDLYREIRVENSLESSAGEKVRLKPGAQVDVTIEAPIDAVEKKPL